MSVEHWLHIPEQATSQGEENRDDNKGPGDGDQVPNQAGRHRRKLMFRSQACISVQDGERNQFYPNTGGENRKADPTGHLKVPGLAGNVAQCLPRMHKALSSSLSTEKQNALLYTGGSTVLQTAS